MDAGPIFTQDELPTKTEMEQETQDFSGMVEINLDDTDIQNIKRTDNTSGHQGDKHENPSHFSKSQVKCLPLSRLLSKLPQLTKFFCMEVNIVGDLYFNIVLVLFWIIYFFGALLARSSDDGSNGNWLWALIWCLANFASCYGVFSGIKHSHRISLVPSLFLVSSHKLVISSKTSITILMKTLTQITAQFKVAINVTLSKEWNLTIKDGHFHKSELTVS